jgi:hypothetical protein
VLVGVAPVKVSPILSGRPDNRKSVTLKARTSPPSTEIFVGPQSTVSSTTGFGLSSGEGVTIDVSLVPDIWAVSTAAAQTLYVLEVGDDTGL